ncbi:MAG: response regulator [Chloroflexota bacterium]|nr:response regulator [Chloroflexota bacterium]
MSQNPARRRTATVRPHVLVVTNDQDLRDFLQEGLLLGGFWVSVIASGVQTLEVFRLRSFDLVVIDAALTGISAIELIRRLRREPGDERPGVPRTDVPLLLIAESPTDEAEAISAGVSAVIVPPIDLEALLSLLHDTIHHWRHRHPNRPWADQMAQMSNREGQEH